MQAPHRLIVVTPSTPPMIQLVTNQNAISDSTAATISPLYSAVMILPVPL